jgi:hypothetical protein
MSPVYPPSDAVDHAPTQSVPPQPPRPVGPVAVQLDVASRKAGGWLDAVDQHLHFENFTVSLRRYI